jgi:prepilin-type N-terminal cleavage/methylation domain-containing protein
MSFKRIKCGGFKLIEIMVAVAVLGMVLAGLALSLHGYAKINRIYWMRQHCIAAAQAQLDSIAVTGKEIPDEDFMRLWPNLTVSIKESAGTGQWKGMKLVEVKATGMSFGKEVQVQLCRYFLAEQEQ